MLLDAGSCAPARTSVASLMAAMLSLNDLAGG
jgi:hypothetical protein